MAIDFKGTEKPRELVPAGAHIAILYSAVELGTMEVEFNGEKKKQRKIRLTWELPEEMRDFDGVQKPMVIGKTYTISLFEQAKLRPIVVGMLGSLTEEEEENFNIKSLLGKPCMLQVTHEDFNGKKYASVVSATQLPKSVPAPVQFNETQYFDYAEFDQETYDKLPAFVKDKMAESDEMKTRNGFAAKEDSEDMANSVPF